MINIMKILVGKKLLHRRNASKNLKEGLFLHFQNIVLMVN